MRSSRMGSIRCLLFWFLMCSLASFPVTGYAQLEDADLVTEEDKDIETILATLNETLRENRELRENMNAVQKALEKLTIEGNVLRSRVRTLEKENEKLRSSGKESAKIVKEQKKLIEALQKEKETFVDQGSEAKKAYDNLQAKKLKLEKLLDTAILESERDEYKNLIHLAQKKADDAVMALSATKLQNEKLKAELDQVYYGLGNAMFEMKNYEGAIRQYKKAVEWNPKNSYAHHNLAVIYDYYLNAHPLAIHHYRRYLDLKPVEEEGNRIRERIVDLELLKNMVPPQPLKLDFNEYHRKR